MKKVGILGIGKMGTAILNGILSNNLYSKDELIIYNRTIDKIKPWEIKIAIDERDLFENSEIIILAVKPQNFTDVLSKLDNLVNKPIIISIAGGITISYLEKYFPNQKIIRAMPNLASAISQSVTTISKNLLTTDDDLTRIIPVFQALGKTFIIPETDMDKTVSLNGSYPAFLYYFINSFIKAGMNDELDPNLIKDMIIETTKGAIALIESDKRDLTQIITDICSPKGITLEEIKILETNNLDQMIEQVYYACKKRSIELGKDN